MSRSYTYVWINDGVPYYVGKGHGRRAFRKGSPDAANVFLQCWDSEEQAFEMERLWIALLGRKDLETGCLDNRDDGGRAPSHRSCSKGGRSTQQRHPGLNATYLQRCAPPSAEECARGGRSRSYEGQLAAYKVSQLHSLWGTGCARGGQLAMHVRWHVKRGILKAECGLCQ